MTNNIAKDNKCHIILSRIDDNNIMDLFQISSQFINEIVIYGFQQLELNDFREILNKLFKLEMKFCLYSVGLPLILITQTQMTALFYEYKNSQLCQQQRIQLNIQKLIIWIIPLILYLIYSLSILNNIKHLIKDDEEKQEIYQEVKKLIKQILLFPIITFIFTLSFTLEDIQSLFVSQIGLTNITISLKFLSFWGFLNILAYLGQDSVRLEIMSNKMLEEQICEGMIQEERTRRLSISQECYFYNVQMTDKNDGL